MAIRRALKKDIPAILRLLALTPNPPQQAEDNMVLLDDPGEYIYIDTTEKVVIRLAVNRKEQAITAAWWLWEGAFENRVLAVLGIAGRAVLDAIPAADLWPISGDFPGAGGTEAERKEDSERQVKENLAWLPGLTVQVSPNNPKMWEGRFVFGDVVRRIEVLA